MPSATTPAPRWPDPIDNSITAGAGNVWLQFEWAGDESFMVLRDDGSGMTATELHNAMRPGSRNPLDERAAGDLGRFGLGLKTASFSQARRLTVATTRRRGAPLAIRCWDLEHIGRTNAWELLTEALPGVVHVWAPGWLTVRSSCGSG